MELSFLLTADYVNVAEGDKLNVMGIFTNIYAPKFPAVHPEFYLIAQLKASPAEYGRDCTIGIKLIDQDATEELVSLSIPRHVPHSERGIRVSLNQIARFPGLVFPKPGMYEFSILVDNDLKGSLAIELIERKPQ